MIVRDPKEASIRVTFVSLCKLLHEVRPRANTRLRTTLRAQDLVCASAGQKKKKKKKTKKKLPNVSGPSGQGRGIKFPKNKFIDKKKEKEKRRLIFIYL